VYDPLTQTNVANIKLASEILGAVFLNQRELALADYQGLHIYDLKLQNFSKYIEQEHSSVYVMVAMNEYVITNTHRSINVWNTAENTIETLEISNEIVEVVPIDNNRFFICHDEEFLTLTNIFLDSQQKVYHKGLESVTCDIIGATDMLIFSRNTITKFNFVTLEQEIVLENLDYIGRPYFIQVVGNKLLLLDDREKVYVWDTRTKLVSECFEIKSSNYFPFCVKGSKVYYHSDGWIHALDLERNEKILSFKTSMQELKHVNVVVI
jgi:hypothetical protein